MLAMLPAMAGAPAGAPACAKALTEAQFARALDEPERSSVVEALAAMVEKLYLHRDQGRAMAAALRENQAQGRYAALAGADAFARTLAADLRAVTPDKHLQVRARIIEPAHSAPPDSDEATRARRERFRRGAAYDGFGIDTVRILAGNVGYLKLGEFWSPAVSGEKLAGAMAVLGETDAIVFDLRESHGGHEDVVSLLMGYFLETPRLLFQSRDASTGTVSQSFSAALVPAPRMRSALPIYVLTSARKTFSAAELLAIALRRHRGAIVVGERTRGGANGGEFRSLSCRFDAFVPHYGSTIGDGDETWEGVGIAPDVPVEAKAALVTAYKAALKKLLEQPDRPADALAAEIRQERGERLRRLEAGEDLL